MSRSRPWRLEPRLRCAGMRLLRVNQDRVIPPPTAPAARASCQPTALPISVTKSRRLRTNRRLSPVIRWVMAQWIRPGVSPVSRALGHSVYRKCLVPEWPTCCGRRGQEVDRYGSWPLKHPGALLNGKLGFLGLPHGLAGSCRSLGWAKMCEVVHTEILGAVRQPATCLPQIGEMPMPRRDAATHKECCPECGARVFAAPCRLCKGTGQSIVL